MRKDYKTGRDVLLPVIPMAPSGPRIGEIDGAIGNIRFGPRAFLRRVQGLFPGAVPDPPVTCASYKDLALPKSKYLIALLPGDGIGPEVVDATRQVMSLAAASCELPLSYITYAAGAQEYSRTGTAITAEVMAALADADAVLLGAMGLPHIRQPEGTEITPQIDIREHYGLFASLRPCKLLPGVPSRLKADVIDILVIRETTEGLFAGRHHPKVEPDAVSDTLTITRRGCERLFELAFQQAELRRNTAGTPGRVTLLDKANVLRSNAFMREVFDDVASRHPGIEAERLYIDAGAMMFVTQPERFDVVVTENVFGDIVSEIGAGIIGGLGLAPSADVGESLAVFQPSHGSAPDLTGRDCANPVATMLSAVMLLEWLASRHADGRCRAAADLLREAVCRVTARGHRTRDAGGASSLSQVTATVLAALQSPTVPA